MPTEEENDYFDVLEYLTSNNEKFHIHMIPKEKQYRLVLQGLPSVEAKSVEDEMKTNIR